MAALTQYLVLAQIPASMLPPVVFYISGHGFGHASRAIEVLHVLGEREPDLRVIVRTSAARSLFERTLRRPVDFHHIECDTGIVQIDDSLQLDARASVRRADEFHRALDARAAREAAFLRNQRAAVVVGDFPPLAFASAAAAGLPSVGISNFTWDWIYAAYPDEIRSAPDLVPAIRRAYASATVVLRLPLWGGFEGLERITRDIPFVARHSHRDPAEVRARFGLPADRPLVLMSFGGYGLADVETEPLAAMTGYTIVATDAPLAADSSVRWMSAVNRAGGSLVHLGDRRISEAGCRYEDLVRAADVVVTKPGYGIVAEAIANDTAILYTSRGCFAEYDVMVREMPRFARCRFIDRADLLAGRWREHLDRLLAQPPPPEAASTDGARHAAEEIRRFLR